MENEEIKIDENKDLEVNKETEKIETEKPKKKKKKISRIITDLLLFLVFVIIVFEIVIGMIIMQRISDEKEPVWYLSSNKVETELKNEVTYNLGLYKIVKTDTSKKTTVSLKPFFIGN